MLFCVFKEPKDLINFFDSVNLSLLFLEQDPLNEVQNCLNENLNNINNALNSDAIREHVKNGYAALINDLEIAIKHEDDKIHFQEFIEHFKNSSPYLTMG